MSGWGFRSVPRGWDRFLGWALVSATVGLVLRIVEDKNERVASFVAGILGMLWSVLTFLVVPVLAYENTGVFDAIRRSGALLRSIWGERLGANFAFGLVNFLLILLVALPLGILAGLLHPAAGILCGLAAIFVVNSAMSAAEGVFKAAAYQYATGRATGTMRAAGFGDLFLQR